MTPQELSDRLWQFAARIAKVVDALPATFANSPLVGQITFTNSGTTEMTTTKQYDYLNRLTSISSTGGASSASAADFNYTYNAANQRVSSTLADGSYWVYGYDSLGQVISGTKHWVDGTLVAGQQFDYTFDTIGNRTQTQAGGDQNGANLRVANYTNNLLNQITSRSVPGYVDVMGLGLATNAVTVNGTTAYRKGEYYRQQVTVTNTSVPVWQSVTNASGPSSVTGHVYVPQTPENYTNDADGNLLSDGRWTYTWDGENRLISMTSLSTAPAGSQLQLTFAYDYQGRRIQKAVYIWNGTSWVISGSATNYAYDGWNCIAALSSSSGLVDSFLWGKDLSGSMQGAGGVGGLLAVTYHGSTTTNCFVAYDGNGNVSALMNAANGTTLANYEYGPFGELIRCSGPMAKLNPFRFSTKYCDDESDLVYYGYRYYNPSTGRWPSRDPIGEKGGLNLYAFVRNAPLLHVDLFGCDMTQGPPTVTFSGNSIDVQFFTYGSWSSWITTPNNAAGSMDYTYGIKQIWMQGACQHVTFHWIFQSMNQTRSRQVSEQDVDIIVSNGNLDSQQISAIQGLIGDAVGVPALSILNEVETLLGEDSFKFNTVIRQSIYDQHQQNPYWLLQRTFTTAVTSTGVNKCYCPEKWVSGPNPPSFPYDNLYE